MVLVAVIAAVERTRVPEVRTARWDVFGALTYLSNWVRIALGEGYWDRFEAPGLADHLWSLAIEEQFYLVWPLALAFAARRIRTTRQIAAAITGLTIMAAYYTIASFRVSGDAARVYLGTDTRAVALLAGATVGAWAAAGVKLPTHVGAVLSVLGLGYCAVALPGSEKVVYQGGLVLIAVYAAVLIATLIDPSPRVAQVLSNRRLRWLGERSYGLYLWHWPVFVAFDVAERPRSGFGDRVTAIAASLVLAELSARLIELPIRRVRVVERGVLRVGGIAVSFAALAAVWPTSGLRQVALDGRTSAASPQLSRRTTAVSLPRLSSLTTSRVPARETSTTSSLATTSTASATTTTIAGPVVSTSPTTTVATTTVPPATTTTAAPVATLPPTPTLPPRDGPPVVMMVGDSVGERIGIAVDGAPDPRVVLVNTGRAGCLLSRQRMHIREGSSGLSQDFGESCAEYVRSFPALAQEHLPDAVVVAFGAGFFHEAEVAQGVWANVCAPEFQAFMRGELQASIAGLRSAGARVFVVSEAYYRRSRRTGLRGARRRDRLQEQVVERRREPTGCRVYSFTAGSDRVSHPRRLPARRSRYPPRRHPLRRCERSHRVGLAVRADVPVRGRAATHDPGFGARGRRQHVALSVGRG